MTDFSALLLPDQGQDAVTLHIVDAAGYADWATAQPAGVRAFLELHGFKGAADSVAVVPTDATGGWYAVAGVADGHALSTWSLARAAEVLPPETYRLADGAPGNAALGWLLAQYRFTRYTGEAVTPRILLTNQPAQIDAALALAHGVALVRDLVNTPAADMGPAELEAAARRVAGEFGVEPTVTQGDALARGFPMIHAVGRAAHRDYAPRLIELEWGDLAHPRIAIVGKGVCFDSGGLDIKPASGMRLMKKDMGGAAHALALARLIMGARLPIRLHLLIPAVENAISGNAFRPGDVLHSRKGTTVEIGNTDAEGRLVLADALTRASEDSPELIIDFATLTGAARVALGPDLPATFANDDALAEAVLAAGMAVDDPLWRLPLHPGYRGMLHSDIADLNNSPDGGFAGAITAALFLEHFVPAGTPWLHLDTFAWMPSAKPGRPKGGEALGVRATWNLLRHRYR